MTNKEYYKSTYDDMHVSAELLEKLENVGEKKKSDKRQWKFAVAAIAAICIICGAVNHEKVVGFAKSLFGVFTLSAKEEKMEFGDIRIVPMNQEKFIADTGTQKQDNMEHYYHSFASYEEMNRISNVVLPGADNVTYKDISLDITPEWGYGHVSARLIYGDTMFNISGMFVMEGFHQDKFGYGDNDGDIVEKYEYGKGKSAYFLKDEEGNSRVYFEEEGILFQMSFHDEETQKVQAKELLDIFGK